MIEELKPCPEMPTKLLDDMVRMIVKWEDEGDDAGQLAKALYALVTAYDPDKRLREALDDLQQAESEYRLMHDRHGDGSQAAGRAWDLLRRAGDVARAALSHNGG